MERFNGDAYRAVYTVNLSGAVYMLHAFQKKAKKGIATTLQDIRLIKERLKQAQQHHEANFAMKATPMRRA